MTRKQLLAYIFLDPTARESTSKESGSVAKLSKWELGNMIISWGYVGKPEDFYKRTEDARALARAMPPDFEKFYIENTEFSRASPEDRKRWKIEE